MIDWVTTIGNVALVVTIGLFLSGRYSAQKIVRRVFGSNLNTFYAIKACMPVCKGISTREEYRVRPMI